ncbi:MAG: DUF4915 domain-containing protein [Rhodospirillales bacterium]|nr:DUF4915 domain-containing protein [Rhodospirillales bacterium]
MTAQIIFSMCNQSRHDARRTHCLAALDVECGTVNWIRSGTTRRDFGMTGIAADEHGFYAAVQSHDTSVRIIHFDRYSFRIISEFPLRFTGDPHSLCIHNGDLLIASTSNNAIFHLARKNGTITSEELYWRHPGTSDHENDVHLNCLASHGGELFVTAFGARDIDGKFGVSDELLNTNTNTRCISGLSQPHTILFHHDRVYCASSATGEVVIATPGAGQWVENRILLRGYTRGLAPWGNMILVGISAHRMRSRSRGNTVDPTDRHYPQSEIALLDKNGKEKAVAIPTTAFGNEVYEIINIDIAQTQAFPRPWPGLRLESLRTAIQKRLWR